MTKRELYRALCAKLEHYYEKLDICGFKHLDNGRCFHGIPCCTRGGVCKHLTDSGCSTHSLSCLIWLCNSALDFVNLTALIPKDPLYSLARSYLKFRDKAIQAAEKHIPLQQRASEEDTFIHNEEDPLLKEITEWFDDWRYNE